MKADIAFGVGFQVFILDVFEGIVGSLEIWVFFENLFPMVDDNVDHNREWSPKVFYRAA